MTMWSEGVAGRDQTIALLIRLVIHHLDYLKNWQNSIQQDLRIATGAGHHSVIHIPSTNKWYIVYRRRPLGRNELTIQVKFVLMCNILMQKVLLSLLLQKKS